MAQNGAYSQVHRYTVTWIPPIGADAKAGFKVPEVERASGRCRVPRPCPTVHVRKDTAYKNECVFHFHITGLKRSVYVIDGTGFRICVIIEREKSR